MGISFDPILAPSAVAHGGAIPRLSAAFVRQKERRLCLLAPLLSHSLLPRHGVVQKKRTVTLAPCRAIALHRHSHDCVWWWR